MILKYSIIIFINQLVFIGCRTWNVRVIAKNNLVQTLISSGIVHITWLIGIAVGAVSMNEIISNMKWEFFPIIFCSLIGNLIGSYVGMIKLKKLKIVVDK